MTRREQRFRYKSRLSVFEEERRKASVASLGVIFPNEQHAVIEDYLELSIRRIGEPFSLLKLQLHLVTDLVAAEHTIAQCKRMLAGTDDSDPEQMAIRRQMHFAQAEARALRDVGDGIAWRLLRYDRAALYAIADRDAAHHVELGGLEAELFEFVNTVVRKRAGTPILNTVTHFLKLGDVTVVAPDGSCEFIEVKNGHKSSGRLTRQKQALAGTVAFLNTGQAESEGEQFSISEVDAVPKAYWSALKSVCLEAGRHGLATCRVGEHLVLEAVDFPRIVEIGDRDGVARLENQSVANAWQDAGDKVVSLWSQSRYAFVRSYAPLSIFPLPLACRVKLMTGALQVCARLNVSAVGRYLEAQGWRTEILGLSGGSDLSDDERRYALRAENGSMAANVPPVLVGRLGFEFLSVRSVAAFLDGLVRRGPGDTRFELVNLSGEPQLWQSPRR